MRRRSGRFIALVLTVGAIVSLGCGRERPADSAADVPEVPPTPRLTVPARPSVATSKWHRRRARPIGRVGIVGDHGPVAAQDGVVAFFRPERGGQALIIRRPGEPPARTALPAFDDNVSVHVGSDSAGRTVAITAGCAHYRCPVRLVDLRSGRARVLPIDMPAGGRPGAPVIHRGVVTFARTWGPRRGIVEVSDGGGPTRLVMRLRAEDEVTALDAGRDGLAVLIDGTLYLRRPGRQPWAVVRPSQGLENSSEPVDVELVGSELYYLMAYESVEGATGGILRRSLRTGRRQEMRTLAGLPDAFAVDIARPDARVFVVYRTGAEYRDTSYRHPPRIAEMRASGAFTPVRVPHGP